MPTPEFTARQNAALHVAYELGQMVGAALRIDTAPDGVTHNALLEATLLHARALIDFLLNGGGKHPDIRGSTFRPGWKIDAKYRQGLSDRKRLLDQHLAHITEARTTDGEQQWPYPAIVRELLGHMREYHAGLPAGSPAEFSIGVELRKIGAALAGGQPSSRPASQVKSTTTSASPVILHSGGSDPLTLTDFT